MPQVHYCLHVIFTKANVVYCWNDNMRGEKVNSLPCSCVDVRFESLEQRQQRSCLAVPSTINE